MVPIKWSCQINTSTFVNKMVVFVKHECTRQQQNPKLAIFSIKVTVKVTRSLTLLSFERVSIVDYAC